MMYEYRILCCTDTSNNVKRNWYIFLTARSWVFVMMAHMNFPRQDGTPKLYK